MESFFDQLNEDVLGILTEYLLLTDINSVINLKDICLSVKSILKKDFVYINVLQRKVPLNIFQKFWYSRKDENKFLLFIKLNVVIDAVKNRLSCNYNQYKYPISSKILVDMLEFVFDGDMNLNMLEVFNDVVSYNISLEEDPKLLFNVFLEKGHAYVLSVIREDYKIFKNFRYETINEMSWKFYLNYDDIFKFLILFYFRKA